MLTFVLRAVLAAICAGLPLMASAQDVRINTARGEVTLSEKPVNVAVLDIAALDTMTALGVPVSGVPDRLYVDYLPDRLTEAKTIGTLFEPDLEALAVLAPELIIAGGRSAAQVEALSQVGPTIDMTIWEDVYAEGRARITDYGRLFGVPDKAAALTAALDEKLAAVSAAAKGRGNALILQTNGPKLSAYGEGSRFGWIHTALKIPQAHENLKPETHGDAVSFEFIADVNPDWIFVIDRSAAVGEPASAAAILDNPLVASTVAGQKGQIVSLSPTPIYIAGGGYTSMMMTLDELAAAYDR